MKKNGSTVVERDLTGVFGLSRGPYRDERLDPIEATDRMLVASRPFAMPTQCLGFACPMPAAICDICLLNPEGRQYGDHQMPMASGPVEEKRHACSAAPTSRGERHKIFARITGRFAI